MHDRPAVGAMFVSESRRYLAREYLVKIVACVAQLSDADLWWRPNEQSNSIGNLLLHLAGNVRQWIVAGVGGAPDRRHRQAEFDERGPLPRAEALRRLETAVAEADRVLEGLGVEQLTARRTIQGRDVTVLQAIYHVVEHFAMHTGQIVSLTKQRTGRDLGFYRDAGGLAVPEWERHLQAPPEQ